MLPKYLKLVKRNYLGSSFLSPAHGRVGARAITLFLSVPPSEKIAGGFQQAGKKEGGWGEGIFARLLSAKGGMGWEAARPCSSKEAKPAKIVSLIKKRFCARPLKEKEIFAGFAGRRQAASHWGGLKIIFRIFVKKGSDFNQKAPPIFRIRILGDYCLAPPKAGLGFGKDFERIFEIQKQFLSAQTEVRRAKFGQNEILLTNLFSFVRQRADEKQSDNLILTVQII